LNYKKLWKERIRVLSIEGQPTRAVLAQTCMAVYFIRSVSDTIFAMLLIPKPHADHLANCHGALVFHGPQFEENYI
jgi:hypothetical protein